VFPFHLIYISYVILSTQQARVVMSSKLGCDVAASVALINDATTRAELWSALARAVPSPLQQYDCYTAAIDAYESDINRVPALVAFGQWLFENGFPLADAEDQLLRAVDL
jgi:hypothetical protein